METLANKIPFSKTWPIVVGICDTSSPIVTTCVINQRREYWLLLDVLTLAIKLYVKLGKENVELQAKIDVAQELDMCMKFKQLGVNMQEQVNLVFQPLFNFIDFFQPTKAHNIFSVQQHKC